jgi:hypothetical protein
MQSVDVAKTPNEFRGILIAATQAVIDGRINVQQANAVAGLASEVHKSVRLEIVGQALSDKNIAIEGGQLVKLSDVRAA